MSREENKFPTRSYPYRYRASPGAEGVEADVSADAIINMTLEAGRIYRFVLGLDSNPQPLSNEEADASLGDPFAQLLLRQGKFPLTLRELLAELDAANGTPEGLPQQKCFLVGDGGQIPWTQETAGVNRLLRFTVVRARDSDARLMISASTEIDSPLQFLQLIAWDSVNNTFNFYERRGGTWIWAGNSYHALMPDTRGQGPFDSHVNGSMVMKELRAPWNNWHSMNAHIREDVLAPGDPVRNEPLFLNRVPAHELEIGVVRPNIDRWNRARLKKAKSSNPQVITDVHYFLRQILVTSTVNLVSSDQESRQIKADGRLVLPTTFFLNTEALLDHIGLDPQITPISVAGRFYIESLKKYQFVLTDGDFRQEADTFFAFLIPEPAFEDLNVLAILLQQKIISRRFAACLLMIDFPNPILSARRKQLMSYVPETVRLIQAPGSSVLSDLEAQFVAALQAKADLVADDPEQEFLANWSLPEGDWKRVFQERIEAYFGNLLQKAKTEEGFDGWVRLAESRRREFRRRALGEFRLTVPTTNISPDDPALMMSDDGSVRAVS